MPIGYKLFKYKNGKLYPLYVYANKDIPIGVWLNAEEGPLTENGKVKSKLGELAYRPGWHINDIVPYVNHIYTIHNGEKYLKDDCVWCEVEYKNEKSYEKEAEKKGWKNGKWSAIKAQLDYIPVGGFYRYKTNPTMIIPWIISGEMKINRIMTDEEVEELCQKHNLIPLKRWKNN